MMMDTSQLRPEAVSKAVEFAKAAGCELEPGAIDPQISLVTKDADTIIAAILAVHAPGGACMLHVCLGKTDDAEQLTGNLISKALMKVNGAGHKRCQISYHGPDDTPANWLGEKWTGEEDPQKEALDESGGASGGEVGGKLEDKSADKVVESGGVSAVESETEFGDVSGDVSGGKSGGESEAEAA